MKLSINNNEKEIYIDEIQYSYFQGHKIIYARIFSQIQDFDEFYSELKKYVESEKPCPVQIFNDSNEEIFNSNNKIYYISSISRNISDINDSTTIELRIK